MTYIVYYQMNIHSIFNFELYKIYLLRYNSGNKYVREGFMCKLHLHINEKGNRFKSDAVPPL